MKESVMAWLAISTSFTVATVCGHTYDETNDVVYAALSRAAFYYEDLREGTPPDNDPPPTTWRGFLGADTNGWTLAGKMAAFDWYLSTLATNDCKSMDYFDELCVRVAVGKCEWFNYTNSASAMKALALNPRGIERNRAIRLAVKFNVVGDDATAFVETIMTNSACYNFSEQGAASAQYASRLLSLNSTNVFQIMARDTAVRMLYRNRLLESGTDAIIDKVFLKYIDGYATSSNRLEYAINAFSYPKCARTFGDYFTSVTNQLLSSGQPLPWINVGGDN